MVSGKERGWHGDKGSQGWHWSSREVMWRVVLEVTEDH